MSADSSSLDRGLAAASAEGNRESLLTAGQRAYLARRRPFEVLLSLVLLVLALPLLGLLAVAIMIDSPGGPLFRQERIGRNGRPFTIFKLRSMVRDAPSYMAKVDADDRLVTRVGGFLRLSGLDELPQLVNVIRGDLNLIGPRPEMPFIVAQFEPWQHRRHELRPGITGWWQIHHRSGDPLHLAIEEDLQYARSLGPGIDVRIVMATLWVMFRGAIEAMTRDWRRRRSPGIALRLDIESHPFAALVED